MFASETVTHHLVLPRDANHHGTLYAGSLLGLALEAAYATAYQTVGSRANLVLKRVLDLRCMEPVPVGTVAAIRGRAVHAGQAQVVIALAGSPLPESKTPWIDGLMQFVQIDEKGRPSPFENPWDEAAQELDEPWSSLRERGLKLLAVRN